jgi:hypothetical protein
LPITNSDRQRLKPEAVCELNGTSELMPFPISVKGAIFFADCRFDIGPFFLGRVMLGEI